MTDEHRPEDEGLDRPVINDKRRIDPETGRARHAEPTDDAEQATAAPADGAPGSDDGELERLRTEAAEAADEIARRKADLYNLQQEYSAYVRRSRTEAATARQAGATDVVEALLGVLDEVELARQHGDLTGPFQAIAEKLEQVLEQRFGLERYGKVGEEFDPAVHEALMHTTEADADGVTVSQVLQSGYRMGEKVLRAARVATKSA